MCAYPTGRLPTNAGAEFESLHATKAAFTHLPFPWERKTAHTVVKHSTTHTQQDTHALVCGILRRWRDTCASAPLKPKFGPLKNRQALRRGTAAIWGGYTCSQKYANIAFVRV